MDVVTLHVQATCKAQCRVAFDVLDAADEWFGRSYNSLVERGICASFRRSDGDRPTPSCAITLRADEAESDAVIWRSGEVELGLTDSEGAVQEMHLEAVATEAALTYLLERMLGHLGIEVL